MNDLYGLFKSQGLDKDLESQMRISLLSRLQGPRQQKIDSLSSRVICSLFLDFLKSKGFKYTSSVFVPECGHSEKLFSLPELSEVLSIGAPTEGSFFESMLSAFLEDTEHKHKLSSATQTEDFSASSNIEEKLRRIELEYISRTKADYIPATLEEMMLKCNKDCERRIHRETDNELNRLREIEMNNLRLEEEGKYRLELQKARKELEEHWDSQYEALKEREREATERLNLKQKELDQREATQKHAATSDLEKLKHRETQFKQAIELEIDSARTQRESWKSKRLETEDSLREAEEARKDLLARVQNEFLHYKRDLEDNIEQDRRTVLAERLETEELRKSVETEHSQARATIENAERLNRDVRETTSALDKARKDKAAVSKELQKSLDELNSLKQRYSTENVALMGKDREVTSLKNEFESLKLNYEQEMTSSQALRQQQTQVVVSLNQEIAGLRHFGKTGARLSEEDEFLANRKLIWDDLERESANIRKSMAEMGGDRTVGIDPFAGIEIPQRAISATYSYYAPKIASPSKQSL